MIEPRTSWSFETFVTNSRTKAVRAAAAAVADIAVDAPNPLLVSGATGSGKSHLLHAIARRAASRGKVLYARAEEFRHLLVEAVRGRGVDPLRQDLPSFDVVLMDDFPLGDDTKHAQEAMFHRLRDAMSTGTRVVLAFEASLAAGQATRGRVRQLRGSPFFATLSYPDVAGRRVIALRAAEERNVQLSATALDQVVRQFTTPRQIQAVVARLALESTRR